MLVFLPTFILLPLLMMPRLTLTAKTNRTIDDTYGDSSTGLRPIYSDSVWNYGQNCTGCTIRPFAENTFMQTWHDTTTNSAAARTVQLLFNGTAIWVYCILPPRLFTIATLVNMTIALDGETVGHYDQESNSNGYNYNVTVYSSTDLANKEHSLEMTAMKEPARSVILFDWAEYTYDDDPEVSTSSSISAFDTGQFSSSTTGSSSVVTSIKASSTTSPTLSSSATPTGMTTSSARGTTKPASTFISTSEAVTSTQSSNGPGRPSHTSMHLRLTESRFSFTERDCPHNWPSLWSGGCHRYRRPRDYLRLSASTAPQRHSA